MLLRRRLITSLALLPLAAQLFTGQARAAEKPFPHVTMAAARAALPAHMTTLKLLRLNVSTTRRPTTFAGCQKTNIPFHNWGAADAFYVWNTPPQDSIQLFTTVYVFRTPAQAAAVGERLTASGVSCARSGSFGPANARWHYTTTVQTAYSTGAWHGYRTVQHAVVSTPAQANQKYRFFESSLTRGNVIVDVEEQVTDSPGRGAIQEGWQLQAQQHVLTALSR